ncbi:MAG: carbohydrate ABC transporter permease [Alphaproteobacteria bacterium]|jgi:multiple sugar transport system permease protein|nr:carbohydrate ABC transporter permease [Alphaproteobacteria bacterium]
MEPRHSTFRQAKWTAKDWQRSILWISLTLFAVFFFLLPVVWMVSSSLTPNSVVLEYPPRWLPAEVTLENYVEVFMTQRTAGVGSALVNSAIVAIATVILTLLVDSLAAYPLARMEFRGKKGIFLLVLVGLMVPTEVTFVTLFLMFHSVGWLGTYQALILPAAASPFGVFLLRQFFLAIPRDLEDAARIDGCSRLRILFTIILPLSKPGLATLAIFTFLLSWNNFLWPLIVMTDPEKMTVPVILTYYVASFRESMEWGTLMAAAVAASVPPVVIFLLFQRHFVRGIATTGLKG